MINVTRTYLPDAGKYKSYVDRIFESGWITNNGQLVQELEKRIKEYLGVRNIVLVSNGTLALQVAYKILNLKGDVITTPFSFVATVSSQVWEGLNPVFVDIDCETLNIDCTKIEKSITKNTSGIIPVHVFGNGCNVEEIERIARKYGLKAVYDAAHAFGIRYKGESILNHGDISVLSFHATKVFHTIEGGALIINDDKLYEKARHMVDFGINGPDRIDWLGINAKMNEFQAAMGLCILDDIDEIVEKRRMVNDYYLEKLSKTGCLKFPKHNENCTFNYGYLPVIFENEEKLLEVKCKLEESSIRPRRYFYPSLETLPYIANRCRVPVSNSISKRILCLPMYDSLKTEEIERIVEIIKTVFNK